MWPGVGFVLAVAGAVGVARLRLRDGAAFNRLINDLPQLALALLTAGWCVQLVWHPLLSESLPATRITVPLAVWLAGIAFYLRWKISSAVALHLLPLVVIAGILITRSLGQAIAANAQELTVDLRELAAIGFFAGSLLSVPHVLANLIVRRLHVSAVQDK